MELDSYYNYMEFKDAVLDMTTGLPISKTEFAKLKKAAFTYVDQPLMDANFAYMLSFLQRQLGVQGAFEFLRDFGRTLGGLNLLFKQRCVFLHGPSNSGKTMTLGEFIIKHYPEYAIGLVAWNGGQFM